MSHSYPSDISREQFALVLPILLTARRRTKPRTVDLYDIFRYDIFRYDIFRAVCFENFPWGAVCFEKRLSMAHAARRPSPVANLLQILPAME